MFQPPNPKVRTSLLKATPEDDCFCFASQMISPSNLFTLQKVSDFFNTHSFSAMFNLASYPCDNLITFTSFY
jgi:hypothetical protein